MRRREQTERDRQTDRQTDTQSQEDQGVRLQEISGNPGDRDVVLKPITAFAGCARVFVCACTCACVRTCRAERKKELVCVCVLIQYVGACVHS